MSDLKSCPFCHGIEIVDGGCLACGKNSTDPAPLLAPGLTALDIGINDYKWGDLDPAPDHIGEVNERVPASGETGDDAKIAAAHPLRTGRHDLYQQAMLFVGARHAKADLVDLVNWQLSENAALRAQLAEKDREIERLTDQRDVYRDRVVEVVEYWFGLGFGQGLIRDPGKPSEETQASLDIAWKHELVRHGGPLPATAKDALIATLHAALVEIDGCFEAAYLEGLAECLADSKEERLSDIINRRILLARPLIQAALAEHERVVEGSSIKLPEGKPRQVASR